MSSRTYHLKVYGERRNWLSFLKRLTMVNKAMERKLEAGTCVDVSRCKRTPTGDYILEEFLDDMDYCDAKREFWIWSIGRHKITGEIIASTSSDYYMNPDYECLFLR